MICIREISSTDNARTAYIIRTVMTEFGAVGEGTSIHDPEVDDMYGYYSNNRAAFYVIEQDRILQGCAGIAPLVGAEEEICELRKMYFLSAIRGKGWGNKILSHCIENARIFGFKKMYLETLASMKEANQLYQKFGFEKLDCTLGNTGHGGCDTYYALDL